MKVKTENREESLSEKIFIGTGGINPGIDRLDIETGMIERVLSLSSGNSVYAVDASGDGNTLAVGTKGGYFYWLTKKESSEGTLGFKADKFIQGSAILSVHLLDNFRAAATDISGRCLIWQLDSLKKVEKLTTDGNVICSLFKPVPDRLAGISIQGKLLLWDVNSSEIIDILQVPKVPSLAALVKPIWWEKTGCWTWPGGEGKVVLFDYKRSKVDLLTYHQTDFYGTCTCGDKLITAGLKDGLLKIWESGASEPAEIFNVPQGIISAASWPENDFWKILLSKETGQSEVFTYKDGCIEFSHTVAVRNGRVIVGPDTEKCKARQLQKITAEAENVCLQIQQNISARNYVQLSDLYQKLENLGFEDASLLLKAKEAQAKGDLLSELEAYNKLDNLPNSGLEKKPHILERYAHLLRKFWLIREAVPVYTRLNNTTTFSTIYDHDIKQLANNLTVMEEDKFVIEPDIEFSLLLKASLLLNTPIIGRFTLKQLGSFHIETSVSLAEFIRCYEELRQKTPLLPHFEVIEQVSWLSKSDNVISDIVVFKNNNIPGEIELSVRFTDGGFETFVNTAVLFNSGKQHSGMPIAQHNQQVIEKLERVQRSSYVAGFIRMVNSGINLVIRQLITKGMSDKRLLTWSY